MFKAKLAAEDLARLKHEAWARVKPNIGLSPELQLEVHKDNILKQWFGQLRVPALRDASDPGSGVGLPGSAGA